MIQAAKGDIGGYVMHELITTRHGIAARRC
jgi:hypothetical protein